MNDLPKALPREEVDAIRREVMRERAGLATQEAGRPVETRHVPARRRIHVICYEDFDAWILGKMARRLVEELRSMEMDVTLGKEQDPAAEINHHIIYFDYLEKKSTVETVMITHIDDERELGKVKRQLLEVGVEMGICMSLEAVRRLAHFGLPRSRLCFIGPAHDGVIKPRKAVVGITTRLYPDGCKQEHLLTELSEHISPAEFRFVIMGSGWGEVIGAMRRRGFEIDYLDRFDSSVYRGLVPGFDFYLYLSRDEGSMGFLDALAAGVPTIVMPQGFHLDVPGGITYPFESLVELRSVFDRIAESKRGRVESVANLNWREYARKHLLVWEFLLCRERGVDVPETLLRELSGLAIEAAAPSR